VASRARGDNTPATSSLLLGPRDQSHCLRGWPGLASDKRIANGDSSTDRWRDCRGFCGRNQRNGAVWDRPPLRRKAVLRRCLGDGSRKALLGREETEMKLRIQGNSLRLRLTRSEVAGLHDTGLVEQTTNFAASQTLTYRIRARDGGERIHAELTDGAITVDVPAPTVVAWATSDSVGVSSRDGMLSIAIEKDFRCLTRPR